MHPDYPGERLICCRNPALAEQRARKRRELVAATDTELDKLAARVASRKLTGQDDIGIAVGKVVNKYKVGKHFILDITDTALSYRHDLGKIQTEAALDGIYVIRTSLAAETLDTPGVITAYKNLARVERDFRIIKVDDLDLRPIFHYLTERVRSHVFLCMLAAYLTWHLRQALGALTYTDEHIPQRTDPVSAAQRSPSAKKKDTSKQTSDGLPARSFRDLLSHLATLNRETPRTSPVSVVMSKVSPSSTAATTPDSRHCSLPERASAEGMAATRRRAARVAVDRRLMAAPALSGPLPQGVPLPRPRPLPPLPPLPEPWQPAWSAPPTQRAAGKPAPSRCPVPRWPRAAAP